MRYLLALLLFTPIAMGILQWREKGYLRLPYNTNGQFGMLRDAAIRNSLIIFIYLLTLLEGPVFKVHTIFFLFRNI
jgi:hypothetical protein